MELKDFVDLKDLEESGDFAFVTEWLLKQRKPTTGIIVAFALAAKIAASNGISKEQIETLYGLFVNSNYNYYLEKKSQPEDDNLIDISHLFRKKMKHEE